MVWGRSPVWVFYMWIASWPSTIWRDYPSPFESSWHSWWKLVGHGCTGLFINSILFQWSIEISLCWDHAVFYHYSFVTKFEISKCETLFSIVLAIWPPCNSTWIWRSVFSFLQNNKIIKGSENLNGKGREDLGRSPRRIQAFELVWLGMRRYYE